MSSTDVTRPPLHPTYDLKNIIKLALAEDGGDKGDVTCLATIPYNIEVDAYFLAKEDGIIAGTAPAEMTFHEVDPSLRVEWSQNDGNYIHKGLQFGKVHGRAHNIAVAERVVLNFMQRMSGIATLTKLTQRISWRPEKLLQVYDYWIKWAVIIGSGRNHRMGLFDMIMIKDNHISIAGGVTNALRAADLYLGERDLQVPVEVETRTLEEVREALNYTSQTKTYLTRIMLDNMASGNVTLETVHKIGQSGVTYISSGSLTHSVKALDISLEIDTELALSWKAHWKEPNRVLQCRLSLIITSKSNMYHMAAGNFICVIKKAGGPVFSN